MLNGFKMKKKSVADLDYSDRLEIFVDPNKIYVDSVS